MLGVHLPVGGNVGMVDMAEFQMPVGKAPQPVAAILVAFDMPIGPSYKRYECEDRGYFDPRVSDHGFAEEVQAGEHQQIIVRA
jgi:hypothetical protein